MKYGHQQETNQSTKVAPARERGLKCAEFGNDPRNLRRSREGAWIEIHFSYSLNKDQDSRSREGAWIEISCCYASQGTPDVAPARERGLK